MAQKVQVILEDDIDGGPATSTVTFALDGTGYEIDLSEENAAKLRDSIAEWIRYARRVGRVNRGQVSKRTTSGQVGGVHKTGEMRSWLIENGYEVSTRGRISAELQEVFRQAH
ncbi:Lsr2 family protein [Rarobacter faecitabidus]|uniref:Lsr2 protein n=1 Tax=Rarobacter faecitabidus TaxID=13243 RepID=A0A542ZU14_RARFA|nr:Lsr2 family protein [Rarobacter faecitabidus]TQL63690.1 Lsr2 protein [Rarobacter faecitabidus]